MVTYIVNLRVNYQIYDEYVAWLRSEHINETLQVDGFIDAELLLKKGGAMEASSRDVSVIYTVRDEVAIKTYLSEKAMTLREKAIDKFPGLFSASREVWLETEKFTLK